MENENKTLTITLTFDSGGELDIGEFSSINIQRSNEQTHINITNDKADFRFNKLFDKIQAYAGAYEGDDKTFGVEIANGEHTAVYNRMIANYHNNAHQESLHFGSFTEPKHTSG